MSVTAPAARLAVLEALETRLKALPGPGPDLGVHVGELVGTAPLLPKGGGRIAPYAVIYPTPGDSDRYPNLERTAGPGDDLLWDCQITFAAARVADLLDALDRVIPHLRGWSPVIDGLECGRFATQPGTNTRNVRKFDEPRPTRFEVPTFWRLHVGTAGATA